jgi:hypothetical protein
MEIAITEQTQVRNLHFKWTISRGQNTYGYNICTLLVDGEKVASCNGGGYDMQGTAYANWLQNAYQSRLAMFMIENGVNEQTPCNTYSTKNGVIRRYELSGYYGMWMSVNPDGKSEVILDGGCGFSCMEKIAKAIGIRLKWNKESDRYKNHSFYTVFID